MVAKITCPKSIARALNYNEQKVQKGHAECIHAGNFLQEPNELNFYDKLHQFQSLIELNTVATTNTLHISLNFDPSEKLDKKKLAQIASTYMKKIGFGDQPYLVYQHLDAGHPHLHIVTTSIQGNGKRIDTYNIGRNQSERARKEIEQSFGLVKASARKVVQVQGPTPVNVTRVKYGLSETKRSITNVLDAVLNSYKYSSLAELNAILKQYNVMADQGYKEGRIYRNRGLTYRVLDTAGNKTGVPIKASSIYSKPTLDYLEKQFARNEILKQEFKKSLKTSIDWIMIKPPKNLQAFRQALEKERISLVIRQNDNGIIYGMTYIDHNTKCVFNGSDIGKDYSAKAILEKCGVSQCISIEEKPVVSKTNKTELSVETNKARDIDMKVSQIMDAIVQPSEDYQYLPYDLKKQKKKKKRKYQQ
jgi:hypothetical protein